MHGASPLGQPPGNGRCRRGRSLMHVPIRPSAPGVQPRVGLELSKTTVRTEKILFPLEFLAECFRRYVHRHSANWVRRDAFRGILVMRSHIEIAMLVFLDFRS